VLERVWVREVRGWVELVLAQLRWGWEVVGGVKVQVKEVVAEVQGRPE
jgi:hypothetical protein